MSQVFMLPDLGEGLTEAEIVEWLVDEGAEVSVDQPVVVVETAKATIDVPCPYAGQVERQHGAVGEFIAVGTPLVTVAPAGDPSQEQYREEERAGAKPPATDEGSGAVLIGYGTSDSGGVSTTARANRRAQLRRGDAHSIGPIERSSAPTVRSNAAVRVISPIVRRLASEHGVDLAALSARHGGAVLRRSDIEAEIAAAVEAGSTAVEQSAGERIPLTGIRRAIADKLTTSRREIPDATTWVDADATGLVEAKDALRAAHPDAGIGVLPLLARICVAALTRYPELNASVDTERHEIVRHPRVNLGFAAQSPRGLVVPVVHGADQLTTRSLAEALRDLTVRAREGNLAPSDLTGGTFTLNNYGVFGVDGSTPIINHPEAAMIGVGRIIERPWVLNHELAIRHVTQVGLTFDHRVCDGGSAGGFLRAVADGIERPIELLADL
ncbi:dihydrolipoamide acetyltransferase family protein [Demetria terragena]|uniref:dihydrolipoamide acetyltransferase family protein n=1 Tax=Demetria terragena TaxID=63959 RepID=UPI0003689E77|nr:dihydrolipoamide acetyltransferase family protein [Demetria terragena]